MIPAVVLDVVRRFLIIQVLLEEAARLFSAVAHTDLARITDSGFRSVRSHQHDLVHRRRLAHRARLRRHADKVAYRKCRLCLTETFHDGDAGHFSEAVEYLRVHGLTRDAGVTDGGQIVFAEILFDEESVHCGRRAECGDLVFAKQRKDVVRMEAVEIVYKCRPAVHPLSIQLAPQSLAPACVGDGQMQAFGVYALPVSRCDEVAERILAAVDNCLRVTRCSG